MQQLINNIVSAIHSGNHADALLMARELAKTFPNDEGVLSLLAISEQNPGDLATAGSLISMKLAGARIGWGIQFEQPIFLGALTLLCFMLAANTWGWFQIPIPSLAGALGNITERTELRRPLLASFLSGILATILATPCSAPFVGTAVGFALTKGPLEIIAIFSALGLGLALPYLAIAAMPRLVLWLPRPGRWMLWLKRALGFSLAATGAWLGFILAQQIVLMTVAPREDGIAWQKFDPTAGRDLCVHGNRLPDRYHPLH